MAIAIGIRYTRSIATKAASVKESSSVCQIKWFAVRTHRYGDMLGEGGRLARKNTIAPITDIPQMTVKPSS